MDIIHCMKGTGYRVWGTLCFYYQAKGKGKMYSFPCTCKEGI